MRKGLIIVALVVGALALALTGGATLAQSGDSDGDSRKGKFAERVASILGIETSQVEDAMQQARTELRDEALQEKLDAMVESGKITQAQADEIKAWVQAKPEGAFKGFMRWKISADDLDGLVESGKITQEQADSYTEYAAWMESRPEVLEGFKGRWSHHGRGYGKGFCKDKDGYAYGDGYKDKDGATADLTSA